MAAVDGAATSATGIRNRCRTAAVIVLLLRSQNPLTALLSACVCLSLTGVPITSQVHAAGHIGDRTRCSTIFPASGIVSLAQSGLLSRMTGRDRTSASRDLLSGSNCYDLFPASATGQNERDCQAINYPHNTTLPIGLRAHSLVTRFPGAGYERSAMALLLICPLTCGRL